MMKSLAFYCPLSTHSLLGKLVWMQHFNQRLTYIIRPCRSRVDGVCVRAFVGRVRAYFTQDQPTNPACFQKVWARGASPLPSPPATAGFQGSPVSQYFWGGYLIPFFWVSLALFGPPSCHCCFLGRSDSSPPLSSDVVSSEGGDAESFVSTCKRETGGVHWNWRAIARKTFFLCLR